MKLRWEKLKRILKTDKKIDWLYLWAGASCALEVKNQAGIINLYVTGRDKEGRSRLGLVKFDLNNLKILSIQKKSILPLGEKGAFDENGTSYPSVIYHDNKYWLFYTGWTQGVQVPWYNSVGLAQSIDGKNYVRYSRAPILHRSDGDFIGFGSNWVIFDEGIFKMWYTRFDRWMIEKDSNKHYYNIKYARSKNGVDWQCFPRVCINFQNSREYAISKPSVIKINNLYHMWYSYRGMCYRIGYAISKDGVNWQRKDNFAGINVSKKGWDSKMVCYPSVLRYKDYLYMFYNGNGYGESGLGLARRKITSLGER